MLVSTTIDAVRRRPWALKMALLTMASWWVIRRAYALFVVPRSLRHLPKVNTWRWFWSVLRGESADVRMRLLMPAMAKHGLCLKYLMGSWMVGVGDPVLLQHILRDVDAYPKYTSKTLDPNLILTNKAPNMGNANAADWRRQRRVANPVFHRAMPVRTFGTIAQTMIRAIQNTHSDGRIDAADYMRRYALDCLGLGIFNFDMCAVSDPNSPYALLYKDAFSIVRDPLVYLFPAYTRIPSYLIPYRHRARKANEKLRHVLNELIEKRRAHILSGQTQDKTTDGSKDLLTMMVEASMAGHDDLSLTDGELVSNLAVFFVAGHETTASAAASTMYYLAAHPDIQERCRAEVLSILGDDPRDDRLPTEEQLRQMTYLDNCIKETLRINPPTLGNLPRVATRDTQLGEFVIPKGTPLSLELYCVHHLEKYWHQPDQFNPDRFDKEHVSHTSQGLWMPFGYGPRTCIGLNFSLWEQRVVQAMMLRAYTWTLAPNSEHMNGLKNASGGVGLLGPHTLELQLSLRSPSPLSK